VTSPVLFPTSYGNPYLDVVEHTSAGTAVSGGGADGTVDLLVGYVLQRVNTVGVATTADVFGDPGMRSFDLAELISWAAQQSGVRIALPTRADLLRAACYRYRTTLGLLGEHVEQGRATKGALLFGFGTVGLSLGVRRRVVVYDETHGVVVVDSNVRTWTEAARIPGARGYR
jgi:hypothetical protein